MWNLLKIKISARLEVEYFDLRISSWFFFKHPLYIDFRRLRDIYVGISKETSTTLDMDKVTN